MEWSQNEDKYLRAKSLSVNNFIEVYIYIIEIYYAINNEFLLFKNVFNAVQVNNGDFYLGKQGTSILLLNSRVIIIIIQHKFRSTI